MAKTKISFPSELLVHCLSALLTVALTSIPLLLIGRATLGEAVIALVYLIPVSWSTARWGQAAGICAAIAAALTFDFFFIPPFLTFNVGSLEGWLVLAIFLGVAILVVGRIQIGMTKARLSERDAHFMYELSNALAGLRTQEAVVHALARHLQQTFNAALVEVCIQPENNLQAMVVKAPADMLEEGKPDRILPILASPGLLGEIRIWRGNGWLPAEDSRLLQNFTTQAIQALERARLAEGGTHPAVVMNPVVD
jgi:two-component system, OmpR family, sensor histidine kinase KdpD